MVLSTKRIISRTNVYCGLFNPAHPPDSMPTGTQKRLTIRELCEGILRGDRVILSKGITLTESKLVSDQLMAEELINTLLPNTGHSVRIGITGIPGVGKSTFIEAFGEYVIAKGKKVAVLAVDPSSQLTRGSIMGDKTRMNELSRNPSAFVRPTPTGTHLGGIAAKSREAMLLCESAGFDVILIETVGVGQSETLVRGMVDFFLLLMIAGAGDELQGIKKGIMEMADAIVVNKADGDNVSAAMRAVQEYRQAVHLFAPAQSGWTAQVTSCSSLHSEGLDKIWGLVETYLAKMTANGYLDHQRAQQNLSWMNQSIDGLLKEEFHRLVKEEAKEFREIVEQNEISPVSAARQLFELYKKKKGTPPSL